MKKQITCIVCPRGCTMTAEINGEQITVTGNSCPRGEKHAIAECTHPVRTLTSSVHVSNRQGIMVSVKSAEPVPKEKMSQIMGMIRSARAQAPVAVGDVIIPNVYGTDIVATKEIM